MCDKQKRPTADKSGVESQLRLASVMAEGTAFTDIIYTPQATLPTEHQIYFHRTSWIPGDIKTEALHSIIISVNMKAMWYTLSTTSATKKF